MVNTGKFFENNITNGKALNAFSCIEVDYGAAVRWS